MEHLQAQLEAKDAVFGDRHNELTLIGLRGDLEVFKRALESALCSEEEIKDWKSGREFSDPWPKVIRRIE